MNELPNVSPETENNHPPLSKGASASDAPSSDVDQDLSHAEVFEAEGGDQTAEEPLQEDFVESEVSQLESKRNVINYKQRYEAFAEELKGLQSVDEKLSFVIDFMESILSVQHASPHFKSFWDARTIAMELFKENVSPADRLKLWERYSTLSKESRRLKALFDEQGAFASEQIEIAIHALEEELLNPDDALAKIPVSEFLKDCPTFGDKNALYYSIQRKLNLLNAQAGRITALRKELIHTEMRVRQKNKFFQRLSLAGDKVFPQRKELIKELSQQFIDDINQFIERHFAGTQSHESLFRLREEIKSLQGIAKELTLNTQAFTKTRLALSQSWDKLKVLDKERKKVRSEQKEHFKHNAENVLSELNTISEQIKSGNLSDAEALNQLDAISTELRSISLGRDEIRAVRDAVEVLRRPLQDKRESEEQHRISQIHERDRLKKFKSVELRNSIEAFLLDVDSYDLDGVMAKREELQKKIVDLAATKSDKQDLERLLKPVNDAIVDKKESALMALSETDRQAFQELHEILKQRQEQRNEIKNQLESIRKARGSSGLDFQRAMTYNAQEAAEKERLEKVSQGIEEIQAKISLCSPIRTKPV